MTPTIFQPLVICTIIEPPAKCQQLAVVLSHYMVLAFLVRFYQRRSPLREILMRVAQPICALLFFEKLRKPLVHLAGDDSAVTECADRASADSRRVGERGIGLFCGHFFND